MHKGHRTNNVLDFYDMNAGSFCLISWPSYHWVIAIFFFFFFACIDTFRSTTGIKLQIKTDIIVYTAKKEENSEWYL